jgi:regulator of replication initiation timing
MTENLLQKLEEKVMSLLMELDSARKEVSRLKLENAALRGDQSDHVKKLQNLVSLLDSMDVAQLAVPVYEEEYATA